MKFIRKASYACARGLTKQLGENNEKRRVYYYGFQVVIGSLTKVVILVSLSLVFGTLLPTLLSVLVFGALRVFAGGFHMDSYGKCLATSIIMFLVAGVIVQYTHQYWSFTAAAAFTALTFALAAFVIYKWAPGDTPNKKITDPGEIRKFKRISLVYITVWLAVTTVLLFLKLNLYVLAGCFGILLEIFAVSPIGYRFFETLKEGINRRNCRHA